MSKVRLWIKGLSYSQTQSGAYALVLSEENGGRTLPIIIGAFEAQSIAIALEKEITPPRPLTHDLFASFARMYSIDLKEVIIYDLREGVFHASIVFKSADGSESVLDSRTSDAVALATRFRSPIYTYENILDKAGVVLDDDADPLDNHEDHIEIQSDKLGEQESVEMLYLRLEQAVKNEDYEEAARLRDIIGKLDSK